MSVSVNADNLSRRRGFFGWLQPEITNYNAVTLLLCVWLAMMLMPFLAFLRPTLLEEILRIPRTQHGTITGFLLVVNDGFAFITMLIVGYLSDKHGRRILFVGGTLVLALGISFNPFAANLFHLVLIQFVVGAGFAAMSVTLGSMLQDYPEEKYRGKFLGIGSIASGLGMIFLALVLTQIPGQLTARGLTQVEAISMTYWIGSGIAIFAGLIGFLGLSRKLAASTEQKPPFWQGLRDALLAAKYNRKIRLGYVAGFASRGDLGVVAALFPLWFMNVGKNAGMESADILARSGLMFGVIMVSGLIAGPVIGFLADKQRREVTVALVFAFAAVAYTLTGLIEDPFDMRFIVPCCILLGFAEIGAIVSCGTLVGQEAPVATRGTIVGWFQIFGGMGITACVVTGGLLFDRVGPATPFLMMGVINLLVSLFGWYTAVKTRN